MTLEHVPKADRAEFMRIRNLTRICRGCRALFLVGKPGDQHQYCAACALERAKRGKYTRRSPAPAGSNSGTNPPSGFGLPSVSRRSRPGTSGNDSGRQPVQRDAHSPDAGGNRADQGAPGMRVEAPRNPTWRNP